MVARSDHEWKWTKFEYVFAAPILFGLYTALAALIGLVWHGSARGAAIAGLIATVPSWKLTLIFSPRSAAWRSRIIALGIVSGVIFAVITATDLVAKIK
jgi:Na+/proline symporter